MFDRVFAFANIFLTKLASAELQAIINQLDSALQADDEEQLRVELRKMESILSDAIRSLPENSPKRVALMAAASFVDNIRNGTVNRFDPDGNIRVTRLSLEDAKEEISNLKRGLLTRVFKPEDEFEVEEIAKIDQPDPERDEFTYDMPGEEASWFRASNFKSALFKQALS